jgi:hypothetical protein
MKIEGSFAATGQSSTFQPYADRQNHAFNMSLWGTFVGTVQLERSFDKGSTWLPVTALGNSITFTGPCTEVFEEPEYCVTYRLNCTAYTSGTINYRLSN